VLYWTQKVKRGILLAVRLTELKPRWSGYPGPIIDGISFQCPHCGVQRLAIKFSPPIDPNGWWEKMVQPTYEGQLVWKRDSGDTWETLSISPSIDSSSPIEFKNHWHGHIRNGEVL